MKCRPAFPIQTLNALGEPLQRVGLSFPINEESLIRAACHRTGLSDFGNQDFREAFGVFLNSCKEDARLTFLGRLFLREFCIQLLKNRLLIQEVTTRNPEILQTEVQKPLVITGLLRTGSTFLQGILAQDPQFRALYGWELFSPCPPPEPETRARDPRVRTAAMNLRVFTSLSPGYRVSHAIYHDRPEECYFALQNTFMFPTLFMMTSAWGYYEWLLKQDLRPVYEYYSTILKILTWRCPGPLLLRCQLHLPYLDSLLSVMPDARIIQTHRDPCQVVPSYASMVALCQRATTKQVDLPRIGESSLSFLRDAVARGTTARQAIPKSQSFDLKYSELVAKPIEEIERLYSHFDLNLEPKIREAMLRHVAGNPQHHHGVHRYDPAMFGLNRAALLEDFAEYRDRYDIEIE